MDFLDLLQASVFLVTAWATVKPLRFQFSSCAGNVEVSFNSLPPDAWQHLLNLFLWGCLHFRGTIQFKFVSPHGLMTSATSQLEPGWTSLFSPQCTYLHPPLPQQHPSKTFSISRHSCLWQRPCSAFILAGPWNPNISAQPPDHSLTLPPTFHQENSRMIFHHRRSTWCTPPSPSSHLQSTHTVLPMLPWMHFARPVFFFLLSFHLSRSLVSELSPNIPFGPLQPYLSRYYYLHTLIPKWFLYVGSHLDNLWLKTKAAENLPFLLLMLHLGSSPECRGW